MKMRNKALVLIIIVSLLKNVFFDVREKEYE